MKILLNWLRTGLLGTFVFTVYFSLVVIQPAWADMFTPSHSCIKPIKPLYFNSKWEIDAFYTEVEEYRTCIEGFVEEQYEAIERHREAAEEAIEKWNSFVRWELQ